MCLVGTTIAKLCPNKMSIFGALDFSERGSEEVISFLRRSVYIHCHIAEICGHWVDISIL